LEKLVCIAFVLDMMICWTKQWMIALLSAQHFVGDGKSEYSDVGASSISLLIVLFGFCQL
jgi:hypothetical protein